jgi:hypothetical protein
VAAENAIMGDDFGTDLPETQVDEAQVMAEKRIAKFVKSNEWKQIKEHLESRIGFYQGQLPDGKPLTESKSFEELGKGWLVAACIIGEFQMVIDQYEGIATQLKEAQSGRRAS